MSFRSSCIMSHMSEIDKAVVLAAGMGTRMQKAADDERLAPHQRKAAQQGHKALMPLDSQRFFLDHVLTALADAGYRRVCLVISPLHPAIRRRYEQDVHPSRLRIKFAIQSSPRGTADAVASAEAFAGEDEFLVINSDNYYPVCALAALRKAGGPALAAFERQALVERSNIPDDRIARFAVITRDQAGGLEHIVEKPDPATLQRTGPQVYVSMNCWRLDRSIFHAARLIPLSPRGELELPAAVEYSMSELGTRYRILPFAEPVLDLSSRGDVGAVAQRLADKVVHL